MDRDKKMWEGQKSQCWIL